MNFKEYKFDNVKESFLEYVHSSGLKVYVIPKKGFNKKYATIVTNYGSINNEFYKPGTDEKISVPDGVAHFLEHKLFEKEDGDVMDKFSALGADCNAYTRFDQTAYLFSCTGNFFESLKILLEYVQSLYVTEQSVEKEKGIIEQEILMYEDSPEFCGFYNMLRCLYINHPVRINIAGTVESIRKINAETLQNCFDTFYHPSNMILVVAGDVDYNKVFSMVEEFIQTKEAKSEIVRIFPDEPMKVEKNYIEKKMCVSIPMFNLGFKDFPNKANLKRHTAVKIIMNMLIGDSSKLYNELYNKGLANESLGFDYDYAQSFAYSYISGESPDPFKAKEYILAEFNRVKQNGFEKKDFERIKRSIFGQYLRSFNSPDVIAREFSGIYFFGDNFFNFYDILNEINIDYVNKVFCEHYDVERSVISIINPIGGDV